MLKILKILKFKRSYKANWSAESSWGSVQTNWLTTSLHWILTAAMFVELMQTFLSFLHHPAADLCIYNHNLVGEITDTKQHSFRNRMSQNPCVNIACPLMSVSLAVFSSRVQLWGISSYFRRLSAKLQHFSALWPRPISSRAFLRMTLTRAPHHVLWLLSSRLVFLCFLFQLEI